MSATCSELSSEAHASTATVKGRNQRSARRMATTTAAASVPQRFK
jgi:hypothetical protein